MANTLEVAGDIDHYGSTHDEDLVVPFRKPSSWKPKKVVVLGLLGVLSAVVVLSSVLRDAYSSTGPSAAHTGPESVLLRFYPYVTITNKTPYAVRKYRSSHRSRSSTVSYLVCLSDYMYNSLPAGQTWTASSRGLCLVNRIDATLDLPDGRSGIMCTPYTSTGTSYSQYSILMKWDNFGDDACCVQSSNQIQKCD